LARQFKTVREVEAVRVFSDVTARQLHSVTTALASERFGGEEKHRANPFCAPIASNVHALEFTAPPTGVLEVLKDNDLTDAHNLTVNVGDQDVAVLSTRCLNGAPVGVDVVLIFKVGRERPASHHQRRRSYIVLVDRANRNCHVLGARINRSQYPDRLFNGFGGVETEILAKEIANDLGPGRQSVRDARWHARRRKSENVGG